MSRSVESEPESLSIYEMNASPSPHQDMLVRIAWVFSHSASVARSVAASRGG
jgi:hypothetical protein